MSSFVIITPARNEEAYITYVINSVVAQSKKPWRWVIVSDGSTDKTDEIVQNYIKMYSWIRLLRMPAHDTRNFASKSYCINAAWESLKEECFSFVAVCDADISFDSSYVEFLLNKFKSDSRLGVAGTPFIESGSQAYDYRFTNNEHVSGGFQLFRRECFEEVGGYIPVETGGEDWIAVTTARMKGWKTHTFSGKSYNHLRPMGTADKGVYQARFASGYQDFLFGNHPLWEVFRTLYQMKTDPFILGGLLIIAGYLEGLVRNPPRPISDELIRFHRSEQIGRLKKFFF